MAENHQPKKPPRNTKAKKLSLDPKKTWQQIVNNVDKREVPIEILRHITVNLIDGTTLTINVRELIDDGQDPNEIEALLDEKFSQLDQYIEKVDFFVDIERVVSTVQPETEKVLKGL